MLKERKAISTNYYNFNGVFKCCRVCFGSIPCHTLWIWHMKTFDVLLHPTSSLPLSSFPKWIYICNASSIKPVWFHVRVQIANKISLFKIKLKSNCWICYITQCNHRKAVNNIHINLSGINEVHVIHCDF